MSIEATGPNADQIAFWNGDAGKSWAINQAVMAHMPPMPQTDPRAPGGTGHHRCEIQNTNSRENTRCRR